MTANGEMQRGVAVQSQHSSPSQSNAEVARHALGPVRNLTLDAISARLQIFPPEEKELLRQSCKRFLPARLLLIDGAAVICAKLVRETTNFHFGNTIVHGTLDD